MLRLKLTTVGTRGDIEYGQNETKKPVEMKFSARSEKTKVPVFITRTKQESKRNPSVTI